MLFRSAITAGGATIYELAALGIPMLCFSYADNQQRLVELSSELGLANSLGDYRLKEDEFCEHTIEALDELSRDYKARQTMQIQQSKYIDFNGAERIAAEGLKL